MDELPTPPTTIDDLDEVKQLLDSMAAHFPIPADLSRSAANNLRAQGVPISPHRQVFIQSALNSGDEGGILCDITPSKDSKEVMLISLTQLKIPYRHPLEKEIRAYQKARIRNLRRKSLH